MQFVNSFLLYDFLMVITSHGVELSLLSSLSGLLLVSIDGKLNTGNENSSYITTQPNNYDMLLHANASLGEREHGAWTKFY